MQFRRRPMRRSDIDRCVDVFAKQADFESAYGGQKESLRQTLKRIVGLDGFLAFLFEVSFEEEVHLLGVGGIAFLGAEFVERVKHRCFRTPKFVEKIPFVA
jgi:hypothetical protein